jgi:DNA-binding transcriptional ArsR family regulator
MRLELGAEGLAHSRFAISPMAAAVELFAYTMRFPDELPREWFERGKAAIRVKRLRLLTVVGTAGQNGYIPDFLHPEPTAHETHSDHELHLVATASTRRIAHEITGALYGPPFSAAPVRRPSALLLEAADCGEGQLAERLAAELEQFWLAALAPHWSQMRDQMEDDIDRRSRAIARDGFAAMIGELSPTINWRDGGLDLEFDLPHAGGATADSVIFLPTTFGPTPWYAIDAHDAPCHRTPLIVYPAIPATPAAPLDDLIGSTRARLLAHLATPRSTTELAELLYLSPSTVSYHLQVLHRAGLIDRIRASRRVLYVQAGRSR